MNLILQAIKALFRKVELRIPTKLSQMENDIDPVSMYDALVQIEAMDIASSNDAKFTLVSGSYADIRKKIDQKIPVTVLAVLRTNSYDSDGRPETISIVCNSVSVWHESDAGRIAVAGYVNVNNSVYFRIYADNTVKGTI